MVTHYLHDLGGTPGTSGYNSHVGTVPRVLIHVNNVLAGTGSAPMLHNTSRSDCSLGRGHGPNADDERFRGVVRDLFVANHPIGAVSRRFLYDADWRSAGPSPPHARPSTPKGDSCRA